MLWLSSYEEGSPTAAHRPRLGISYLMRCPFGALLEKRSPRRLPPPMCRCHRRYRRRPHCQLRQRRCQSHLCSPLPPRPMPPTSPLLPPPAPPHLRLNRGARGLCGRQQTCRTKCTTNRKCRPPVETPNQRNPAAADEERGVVIFEGSVSIKFGE